MHLIVQTSTFNSTAAVLITNGKRYDCTLGRSGVTIDKNEGDGATPIGTYPLRRVFYRADKIAEPETALPVIQITDTMGWCDDPAHAHYNRLITLPFNANHETLMRQDHCYDIIITLGHNDDPVIAGKGSAIFMHLRREDEKPTEGCVGLDLDDLLEILKNCTPDSQITILPPAES